MYPLLFYHYFHALANGIAYLILVVFTNCSFGEIQEVLLLILNSTSLLNLLLELTAFCGGSLMLSIYTCSCHMQTVMVCILPFGFACLLVPFLICFPWSELTRQCWRGVLRAASLSCCWSGSKAFSLCHWQWHGLWGFHPCSSSCRETSLPFSSSFCLFNHEEVLRCFKCCFCTSWDKPVFPFVAIMRCSVSINCWTSNRLCIPEIILTWALWIILLIYSWFCVFYVCGYLASSHGNIPL